MVCVPARQYPGIERRGTRRSIASIRRERAYNIRSLFQNGWKHVNVRRCFACLERSIGVGMRWAAFETNGTRPQGELRRTIEDSLVNEWRNGARPGDKAAKACFVTS